MEYLVLCNIETQVPPSVWQHSASYPGSSPVSQVAIGTYCDHITLFASLMTACKHTILHLCHVHIWNIDRFFRSRPSSPSGAWVWGYDSKLLTYLCGLCQYSSLIPRPFLHSIFDCLQKLEACKAWEQYSRRRKNSESHSYWKDTLYCSTISSK